MPSPAFLEPIPDGVILAVRVIPRAAKTAVAGTRDGALLVRLSAPPVDDAANNQLLDLIAATLRVTRRQVSLLSGTRGRDKRVKVVGVDWRAAHSLLAITVS